MRRRLHAATLAAGALVSLGNAPLQCAKKPDPDLRVEDTAGDALWDLAEDFRAKGNPQAARETLQFLVERYPSNRHADTARAALEGGGPDATAP